MRLSFSFLLRWFRVVDLEPKTEGVECVTAVFCRARRERERRAGARRARHPRPFPDPVARRPGGARRAPTSSPSRRRGPARRWPSGSRSSSGSTRMRASPQRSCSSRRASSPSQVAEEMRADRGGQGPPRRGGLRRCRDGPPDQARQGGAGARRDTRPAPGPDRAAPRLARRRRGSSSSTRPTGCSTWASSPRSTSIVRRIPRERQTMLFSATLDGEVGRARRRVHAEPGHASRARCRSVRSPARSTTGSSRSPPDRQGRRADRGARGRSRPRARVRADEARRRPARCRSSSAATSPRWRSTGT